MSVPAAGGGRWPDDQQPHDESYSNAQIDALLAWLGRMPARVLDLGCGTGRTLVPLAQSGHRVTGMDRSPPALDHCSLELQRGGVADRCRLVLGDFTDPWPDDLGRFRAVCCLGNTMMTVVDVGEAVELLRRAEAVLESGGAFIMDDCPHEFWPELTEGNWLSGVTEDGTQQLVWAPGDSVFVLRRGADVDDGSWEPVEGDRPLRLWSMGALELAAAAAGLSAAQRQEGGGLLVMRVQRG